jgi:hypothetical protein
VLESPLVSKSNPNPSEQEMIEFVPSGYISIREALSRSIWCMRARPLAAPRVSSGSGDCSLRNVSRIGTIQRNRPLQRAKILARAAYPQDRSSNAIVSGGGFLPIRRELSRHFKYMDLKGISTGDFEEALIALLGKDAGGSRPRPSPGSRMPGRRSTRAGASAISRPPQCPKCSRPMGARMLIPGSGQDPVTYRCDKCRAEVIRTVPR